MTVRAIVLAAGRGTRMQSERPKMLHELCGRPMVWHVLRALRDAGIGDVTLVASGEVLERFDAIAVSAGQTGARVVTQEPQLGTGHAVSVALGALPALEGKIVVLNGDMPLVDAALVRETLAACTDALALVSVRMPLPSSFGRVVRDGDRVSKIVEARDATGDELAIDEMNAGLYAYDERALRAAIAELRNDNAQSEYYLTDTVAHLHAGGRTVSSVPSSDPASALGVNDRVELAAAAALLNRRLCEAHMRAGVTIVDPATTYLEPDLVFARDVTILPNTTIGARARVGAHSEIGPNVRLSNAVVGEHAIVRDSIVADSTIGDFAIVGPYAHVRGESRIGTAVRVGNFVEIKKSDLAGGVKAGHLTYLGDATIGERSNIGAGTITCNFDGQEKHPTTIGDDVFVGSNSSLVAPVSLGDGALTGAGSVVIADVPPGARVAGNPARSLPPKDSRP